MVLRAVVFDLDGVLGLPSVFRALGRSEEALALPRGFLNEVFKKGGLDGVTARTAKGEIMFSQWVPLIEEDCRKHSKDCGISLPENFSIKQIFCKAISERKVNHRMLQAACTLRKKGFTTCILTNKWVDDTPQRSCWAQLMYELKPHFDFLIESSQIGMAKPNPEIYKFTLDTLKASPHEVVFLDDMEDNLKPARDLGMITILVRDSNVALQELEEVTGMQLLNTLAPLPTPCCPSDVSHGYVQIKPGVHLHFVEMGSGPAVCLCHGFPESWFSWKYQIPALAQAGFRVLALDLKGYGESSAPPEIEEYSLKVLCEDMVTFLDKLGILQAVFIGHNWGSILAWNMALFYPERMRAVASLNTPLMLAVSKVTLTELSKTNPIFGYYLYFQEPGVAEAELEEDLERTFKTILRAHDESFPILTNVHKMERLFVKVPKEPSLSKLLSEEDIQYYVQQFKKSGFRGPLNWYRNADRNWEYSCKVRERKIMIPALMVTAEDDLIFSPEMSKHMEDWVPHLTRRHIKDCGHFTQIEQPDKVNQILLQWLESEARDPPEVLKL